MISLVANYFHPGQETIEDFLIRNKQDEANNQQFAEEFIARGIEVKAITASLTKNCTGNEVVKFMDHLTEEKIPME